jgi:hypothetical protein
VLRDVPTDAIKSSLDTLVEVKERIKSLHEKGLEGKNFGETPDDVAAK